MKTFVQYGAGNIGRGFIGQIFSEAGYLIRFIDVDINIINALNKEKRYPIKIVSNEGSNESWVENVDGINGFEQEKVISAIAACNLMATAVGVHVLPQIVPNIIAGIKERIRLQVKQPLNIIICENLLDADKLLFNLISEQLNADENNYFTEYVGLVEASIGRMVPVMTNDQRQGNILRVCVESYCELPIDKAAFKGTVPDVPHLFPFEPFEYYIKRKLFVHNMAHALTAYLGNLVGYTTVWQAIENPMIKKIVQRAMAESAKALSKKFNIPMQSIAEHVEDLLLRFSNAALGDTVRRVGKDTKRKLSSNDRFTGAIKFCKEQGTIPVYIPIGIAAGLLFTGDDDGTAAVREKLKIDGINATLRDICGIGENDNLTKAYFALLSAEANLQKLLLAAENFNISNKEMKRRLNE